MGLLRTMWKRVTEPRATDPEEARREYMTRTVLTIMVLVLLIATAAILIGWAANALTFASVGAILLLDAPLVVALWLTYRGRWHYAASFLPPVFLGHAIYVTYVRGFGSWPLAFCVLTIMLTGMLHGIQLQWYMVGLSTVCYGMAAWLHGDRAVDLLATGVALAAALFSGLTLLQWLFISQLERANRHLRQEVEERRRVEKTLHQTQNQLFQAQKLEAIGRLAGGVAHDFNNLLTVVELSARMISQQLHPADPLWEHVRQIQEASERGIRLTRQLLSFSRRGAIEPQPVNLNHIVAELSRMLQRIVGEEVEVVTDLADELWYVEADPTHVEQVIVNLAVNGRDAMPKGGRLAIQTANQVLARMPDSLPPDARPGEYVVLCVSDTGVGMDDDIKAHVFEPFFTTKTQERGTGLGLPTVYGIVRQNGGYIGLESQVGQGTTFTIYLPRCEAGVAEAAGEATARPAPAASAPGSETVLVVEDETAVLGLARQILEEQGYQVLVAGNGPEALQVGQEQGRIIDLLLTDVVMPGMNGRELAERLRPHQPGMKVLYMSGYSDDALASRNLPGRGLHFLAKPFSMDHLVRKVRAVLDAEE